jgi:hypothetical protein
VPTPTTPPTTAPAPPTSPPTPDNGAPPNSVLGDPAPEGFDEGKLTLPEGFDAKGDGFEEFKTLMKDSGSSQKSAQGLVDLYAKSLNAALKTVSDDWHKQQGDWQREIQADPELGGRNLDVVKQTVSKVLDNPELTDPKFREALIFTGAGNNPAIVRSLYRWAKALSEGGAVSGMPADRSRDGSVNGERPTIANAIYGPAGPHSGGPRI